MDSQTSRAAKLKFNNFLVSKLRQSQLITPLRFHLLGDIVVVKQEEKRNDMHK